MATFLWSENGSDGKAPSEVVANSSLLDSLCSTLQFALGNLSHYSFIAVVYKTNGGGQSNQTGKGKIAIHNG
jgi:hypothetical protein